MKYPKSLYIFISYSILDIQKTRLMKNEQREIWYKKLGHAQENKYEFELFPDAAHFCSDFLRELYLLTGKELFFTFQDFLGKSIQITPNI